QRLSAVVGYPMRQWRAAWAAGSHPGLLAWLLGVLIATLIPGGTALANDNAVALYAPGGTTIDDPHLRSLNEYVRGGEIEVSLLGVGVGEDERGLKSGATARGLAIIAVTNQGPADGAGLKAAQVVPKQVLSGLVVAGSMAFPPAILLLPIFASPPIGRDG